MVVIGCCRFATAIGLSADCDAIVLCHPWFRDLLLIQSPAGTSSVKCERRRCKPWKQNLALNLVQQTWSLFEIRRCFALIQVFRTAAVCSTSSIYPNKNNRNQYYSSCSWLEHLIVGFLRSIPRLGMLDAWRLGLLPGMSVSKITNPRAFFWRDGFQGLIAGRRACLRSWQPLLRDHLSGRRCTCFPEKSIRSWSESMGVRSTLTKWCCTDRLGLPAFARNWFTSLLALQRSLRSVTLAWSTRGCGCFLFVWRWVYGWICWDQYDQSQSHRLLLYLQGCVRAAIADLQARLLSPCCS